MMLVFVSLLIPLLSFAATEAKILTNGEKVFYKQMNVWQQGEGYWALKKFLTKNLVRDVNSHLDNDDQIVLADDLKVLAVSENCNGKSIVLVAFP